MIHNIFYTVATVFILSRFYDNNRHFIYRLFSIKKRKNNFPDNEEEFYIKPKKRWTDCQGFFSQKSLNELVQDTDKETDIHWIQPVQFPDTTYYYVKYTQYELVKDENLNHEKTGEN